VKEAKAGDNKHASVGG